MLKKINTHEYMTVQEMQLKYPDHWFRYGVEKNNKIRTLYIADTRDELLALSDHEMIQEGVFEWGNSFGENLIPDTPIEMGGMEIAWA